MEAGGKVLWKGSKTILSKLTGTKIYAFRENERHFFEFSSLEHFGVSGVPGLLL